MYLEKNYNKDDFLRIILQPADASVLYDEILKMGPEEWWPRRSRQPSKYGIIGSAKFKTFKHAFQVLIKGSSIKFVTFHHRWYSDWFWVSKNWNDIFFDDMGGQLNDDCIREIIRYIDIPHRVYFASINERFRVLTLEVSHNLCIFPSSFRTIDLMNFRYLLELFGNSVINLSVSLTSFASTFGFYSSRIKAYILDQIYACTGPNLKSTCTISIGMRRKKKKAVKPYNCLHN